MSSPITEDLKAQLKRLLGANQIRPSTRTALKYEYFFVNGAYAVLGQEMPPALIMLMMSGRSILDRETPVATESVAPHEGSSSFNTAVIRSRMRNAHQHELTEMLADSLRVIDTLRQDLQANLQAASDATQRRDVQWLQEKHA